MLRKLMAIAAVFLFAQISFGVSIAPEIVQHLKDTGQLEQVVQADRLARDRGVWEANPDPIQLGGLATDIDTVYCIIVLVDFEDMQYTDGLTVLPEQFDSLLFSEDVFEPGSMTDYYFETSYGGTLLLGEVTQWYRMPQTYDYYVDGQRGFGNYPRNAQRLAQDAVLAADPDVDFEPYDNDGDTMVDGLFIVHAGPGYEDTGNVNYIHSHAWQTYVNVWLDDGVYVSRYSMEPEETASQQIIRIGVFCHEFGHVLGLPDLYDYDYDSDGCGYWSIMSAGSWGDGGRTPVHFDAWSKMALGFVNPTTLDGNLFQEQIDAAEYSPDIYRLFSLGAPMAQYFMVENRRREMFDAFLPGDGLLIYHVDDDVDNNNDQTHYHVAVEQADGEFDLENNRGSDSGDPWPGYTNNRTFDDFSVPDAHLYFYGPSEVAVANISDSDSTMYADLFIWYDAPLYELLNVEFDDTENGNGNGYPEAGETCDLIFTAQNVRADADNLNVTASSSAPEIVFTDDVSSFGDLPINTPFDNESDLITFEVPDGYPNGLVNFTLTFSANDGDHVQEFVRRVVIGEAELLLVDDDDGDVLEMYYTDALDELDIVYEVWDISAQGSPAAELAEYPFVIWFTGNSRPEDPLSEDVIGIIDYLDNGGRLLMTSQDFVQRLHIRWEENDQLLLQSYMKVSYLGRESNHFPYGEDGTPFYDLEYITGGNEGANNQSSQDKYVMLDGAVQLLTYTTGTVAAAGVTGDNYGVVTCGFGAEGINNDFQDYDSRASFINAAITFLTPSSIDESFAGLPNELSLSQNYPNPFNARTTISYSLDKQADVKIEIYDILGRMIATLVEDEQPAGSYQVNWDAGAVSSGIYFYKIQAGDIAETRKMVLLK
ncbi:MAG: M6 family metalloprotease domain-containing protein [candidate division Zixibacteria bacterium]|nr:M6 family metalloprotease domain-containing protein [candidate division Zixibacteria bacterium]